ncbi:hypothetical protein M2146_002537 [Lachnospiraceae bacterium PF1-22]
MGWTGYHATHYKNGKIDRKAECESQFDSRSYKILASSMVGSVWYAAIQKIVRKIGEDENGPIFESIPESERITWAAIFLTSTDHFDFSYKDMDETVGPCECACPKKVLKLLSPTESEWANDWRERCLKYHEEKSDSNSLSKLPVGTKISAVVEQDLNSFIKKGYKVTLEKKTRYGRKRNTTYWFGNDGYRWSKNLIPKNYVILKRGD